MANPPTTAADVVNQALDEVGAQEIPEMYDGSRESRVAIRHYGPTIRALLRSAHWNFARKLSTLSLAKDATNTDGTLPTDVPQPWLYEYLYPQDCVKVRFVPWLAPPINEDPPLMTGLPAQLTISPGNHPAPFVIGTDLLSGPDQTGISVILTNVQNAQAVYTAAVFDPQQWDATFMQAVVAMLAARFAMPLVDDKKLALEMRNQQIAIVKDLVGQARVSDGNETWTTTDHIPDWFRVRGFGGWPFGFWNANVPGGAGLLCGSWDSLFLPDGSAY